MYKAFRLGHLNCRNGRRLALFYGAAERNSRRLTAYELYGGLHWRLTAAAATRGSKTKVAFVMCPVSGQR